MPEMERPRLLVPWLRRGLEAGVFGALLSAGTVLAFQLSVPEPRLTLPTGVDGALILAPAVLALAVFCVSYPVMLAATREEALMGAIVAFLVAADLLMALSVVLDESIRYHPLARMMPLGVLAAGLAVPPAVVGLLVGQLTTSLGFGRSAAYRTAWTALVVSILAVALGAHFS